MRDNVTLFVHSLCFIYARLVDMARRTTELWEHDDTANASVVHPSGAKSVRTAAQRANQVNNNANAARCFLVIDDSEMNRKMVARTLTQVCPSAKVVTADDGDTGVAAMRQAMMRREPFHAVFVDLKMNKMHGPEAIRIMRQELGYQGLIIVLTGSRARELESAAELLADYLMEKPLSKAHLELMFNRERVLQAPSPRRNMGSASEGDRSSPR
jgi:CheY-like chemotaxis protein